MVYSTDTIQAGLRFLQAEAAKNVEATDYIDLTDLEIENLQEILNSDDFSDEDDA